MFMERFDFQLTVKLSSIGGEPEENGGYYRRKMVITCYPFLMNDS